MNVLNGRPRCRATKLVQGDKRCWETARVNIDYHIEVERHYYSVPYALVHQVSFLAWLSEHKDVLLFQHVRSRESSSAAC